MTWEIRQGDALEVLRTMPAESIHCCVTSPPYWGLRDYGVAGQLGLERTPEEYISKMVEIFGEVRRVLRSDGTLWLNMGDCYAMKPFYDGDSFDPKWKQARNRGRNNGPNRQPIAGLKGKDLVGMPWMLAFALRADGWWLRSDIIWAKPNPMPESVTDRPTKAHEYIFLLSKSEKYFYDAAAIKEPVTGNAHGRGDGVNPKAKKFGQHSRIRQDQDPRHLRYPRSRQNESFSAAVNCLVTSRNRRSVWNVATAPFKGAHFATFPPKLIEPCILAGSPGDGTILDPFAGASTTGVVAVKAGRSFIGIELKPEYIAMGESRIRTAIENPQNAKSPKNANRKAAPEPETAQTQESHETPQTQHEIEPAGLIPAMEAN